MQRALMGLLLWMAAMGAQAEIVGKSVDYQAGNTMLTGYLAYETTVYEPRPVVLVVHEWWGHNAYARERARKLAEMGYVGFAIDMYGKGKRAEHPDDAKAFSSELKKNMPEMIQRFKAAMEVADVSRRADASKMAAIGYCFGGGVVLEMARQGMPLKAVASFHGGLSTEHPAKAGAVKAKVLVANGAEDPVVSAESIQAFKAEMDKAGADYRFINYPGAKHSFTNPDADRLGRDFSLPLAYNPAADQASWKELKKLLKEVFGE